MAWLIVILPPVDILADELDTFPSISVTVIVNSSSVASPYSFIHWEILPFGRPSVLPDSPGFQGLRLSAAFGLFGTIHHCFITVITFLQLFLQTLQIFLQALQMMYSL